MKNNQIAVLDFGGQYAHLIANRIRRLGVKSVIKPAHTKAKELKDFSGIILSGGPLSVNNPNSPTADPEIFQLGIPTLGICYGHQVTNHVLGGKIKPGKTKEYGHTIIHITKPVGIFEGISKADNSVWSSHWDEVVELPVDFEVLASSKDSPFVAVGNLTKHIYGIQFHAEVTHTKIGKKIFQNFINITGAEKTWNTKKNTKRLKQYAKEQIISSGRNVFMLVSGGVDSVVAFTLLKQVVAENNIPKQIYGMLVDTGFMRKGEIQEVTEALHKLGYEQDLHVYDAKDEFFKALKGVFDPEEKRHIIGKLFVEIQARAIQELDLSSDAWLLGQGTIYPDTIESGVTKHADKIKTHHNRVPEIMNLIAQGLVIEPIADLYKDEVRELGEQLGLPHHLVWRHPFPGPGLAIRCLCTKTDQVDNQDYQHEQDTINTLIQNNKLFGTVLPVKSVGVQGDDRTYKHPLLISGPFKWKEKILQELSTTLTNKFESINRVLLHLSDEAPKNFKLIANSYLTKERIELLQKADKIVMDEISVFDTETKNIWQCPTILIPLSTDGKRESIVIRPFSSKDVMSANFALFPPKNLQNIIKKLKKLPITGIFYDITNKPPGTIEWE